MRTVAARLVLALALVVLLSAGNAGGAAVPHADDTPRTTMRIALQPDGDARWTVTMRFDLGSANDARGFDRLAEEFEDGETDVLSVDPFRRAAKLASDTTGRPMLIEDVSRSASRANDTGRLSLSFTWTSFARTADGRMELGDVFRTPTGTWLPELDAEQELIIEFPREFSVISSSRGLHDGAFHIRGPEKFQPGEPSATLERRASTPTDATGGTTTTTTETPAGFSDALGIGGVLLVLVALVLLVDRRRKAGGGETVTASSNGGSSPSDGGEVAGSGGEEPLLSDEERVLRLLSANDGRMKQADIVDETDWSNAKVSQLLSEMDERGEVEKLRIGRENLISLSDEAPDDSG